MISIIIPPILKTISIKLSQNRAKPILVGGSIRDYFLGLPSKDYDVEVFNIEIDRLIEILSEFGNVNLVGKSFGVLKFSNNGDDYDFSIPRKESKTSSGHRGFDIETNPNLSFKEASNRRDFTINSMGYDILKGELLDPYDGYSDIQNRVIRYVDRDSFIEDSLRVYRGIGFASRFGFKIEANTQKLFKSMIDRQEFRELSKERVFIEFNKILLKSHKPSVGFELIREFGILKYFPPLQNIIGVPQDSRYHLEGDVWIHTMMSLDAMAIFKEKNLKLLYAILCHDLGKATHTQIQNNKISAIGHEKAGIEPTKEFLYSITNEHKFIDSILPLVEHHLKPSIYFRNGAKNSTIRKLATKVNISELILVAKADFLGRTTEESKSRIYRAGEWLATKSKELEVDKKPLKPILQGRDLIEIGLKPSKEFGVILEQIYQLQLDGVVNNREEALKIINKLDIINKK